MKMYVKTKKFKEKADYLTENTFYKVVYKKIIKDGACLSGKGILIKNDNGDMMVYDLGFFK